MTKTARERTVKVMEIWAPIHNHNLSLAALMDLIEQAIEDAEKEAYARGVADEKEAAKQRKKEIVDWLNNAGA
jgi:hypothetical protein